MAIKVGINGFGRIGRNVLRSAVQNFGNGLVLLRKALAEWQRFIRGQPGLKAVL